MSYSSDYEFRTTVVPGIVTKDDIHSICERISGARRYVLQQFSSENTLDPEYSRKEPYEREELEKMREICRGYVEEVKIKNI